MSIDPPLYDPRFFLFFSCRNDLPLVTIKSALAYGAIRQRRTKVRAHTHESEEFTRAAHAGHSSGEVIDAMTGALWYRTGRVVWMGGEGRGGWHNTPLLPIRSHQTSLRTSCLPARVPPRSPRLSLDETAPCTLWCAGAFHRHPVAQPGREKET
jgi:hypothetical protein